MSEKVESVAEARRQLTEAHAKLRAQTDVEEFQDLLDEVLESITDEELQKELDNRKPVKPTGD